MSECSIVPSTFTTLAVPSLLVSTKRVPSGDSAMPYDSVWPGTIFTTALD